MSSFLDILLAEDNVSDQDTITGLLRQSGPAHSLDIVVNGRQALDAFVARVIENQRPFDLILLDCSMSLEPGALDTAEMIRRIESQHDLPTTPIVVLASAKLPQERLSSLIIGDQIDKPIKQEDLLAAISKLTNQTTQVLSIRPQGSVPPPA